MTLVKRPFGETFTFARPIAADYRDGNGEVATAGVNIARFDHTEDGIPRGLLVERGPDYGNHDALQTVAAWDDGIEKAMVLHEYEQDGEIRRTAYYTERPKAMADACLRLAVHHRRIVALDGWKRNRGGYVRWDSQRWYLGALLESQPGPLASPVLADLDDRLLIEG